MSVLQPLNPAYGSGITVTPNGTSARSLIGAGSKTLCITNTGSVACYLRTGDSTATATTADYIVLPGMQVTITKAQDRDYVAYITASGTGALNIIPGEGF